MRQLLLALVLSAIAACDLCGTRVLQGQTTPLSDLPQVSVTTGDIEDNKANVTLTDEDGEVLAEVQQAAEGDDIPFTFNGKSYQLHIRQLYDRINPFESDFGYFCLVEP
jgi:hypothetical protein